MSHDTPNRPRMAVTYAPGTVRARHWHGADDVRGYRPPRGWTARADLIDLHPITGRALPRAVCWIIEAKEYGAAQRPSRSVLGAGNAKNPGTAVAAPGFKAQSQNAPSPPSVR